MEVKVKLWAGADKPKIDTSSFDIVVHSFRKIFKGKAEVDIKEVLKHSLSNGYITLRPFERILIGTGIEFDIPQGLRLEIVNNPGFTLTKGITLMSSPNYVDSSYKKELLLILHNPCQFLSRIQIGDIVAKGSFVEYKVPEITV